MTQSLRRADEARDIAPNWITGVEDAVIRQDLDWLLDAEGQPGKLDAEWLAAQEQIRQTWSG